MAKKKRDWFVDQGRRAASIEKEDAPQVRIVQSGGVNAPLTAVLVGGAVEQPVKRDAWSDWSIGR